MGLLSFVAEAGKKLLGLGDDAKSVKDEIAANLSSTPVEGLEVEVQGELSKKQPSSRATPQALKTCRSRALERIAPRTTTLS